MALTWMTGYMDVIGLELVVIAKLISYHFELNNSRRRSVLVENVERNLRQSMEGWWLSRR